DEAADLVRTESRPRRQRHRGLLLRVERVDPVCRITRTVRVAGPILTTSRFPRATAPRIFLPPTKVPFLLSRSSIDAPAGPIATRACRRATDSSSLQTTH